jgi:hypothetical protein
MRCLTESIRCQNVAAHLPLRLLLLGVEAHRQQHHRLLLFWVYIYARDLYTLRMRYLTESALLLTFLYGFSFGVRLTRSTS